ncbi:MAG: hypothetical protein AAF226_10510, partial [Verrucomicrobiota bacterium]
AAQLARVFGSGDLDPLAPDSATPPTPAVLPPATSADESAMATTPEFQQFAQAQQNTLSEFGTASQAHFDNIDLFISDPDAYDHEARRQTNREVRALDEALDESYAKAFDENIADLASRGVNLEDNALYQAAIDDLNSALEAEKEAWDTDAIAYARFAWEHRKNTTTDYDDWTKAVEYAEVQRETSANRSATMEATAAAQLEVLKIQSGLLALTE